MSDGSSSDPRANPVPFAGQADFAALLRRMQPRGKLWEGPDDTVMAQLRVGQVALMAQFAGRLAALTESESYPPTSIELLPAWNKAFSLPDPCMAPDPTVEQQQSALAAKIAQNRGLSRASIIAVVAALGYTITIDEFRPARFGEAVFGGTFAGPDWGKTWQVNAPEFAIDYAKFGSASFGDYYASWGSTELQCVINRIAPPNTIVIFNYS